MRPICPYHHLLFAHRPALTPTALLVRLRPSAAHCRLWRCHPLRRRRRPPILWLRAARTRCLSLATRAVIASAGRPLQRPSRSPHRPRPLHRKWWCRLVGPVYSRDEGLGSCPAVARRFVARPEIRMRRMAAAEATELGMAQHLMSVRRPHATEKQPAASCPRSDATRMGATRLPSRGGATHLPSMGGASSDVQSHRS